VQPTNYVNYLWTTAWLILSTVPEIMGLGVGCVNNVNKIQPIMKFIFEFYRIWQFEVTCLKQLMVVTGRICSVFFFTLFVKLYSFYGKQIC